MRLLFLILVLLSLSAKSQSTLDYKLYSIALDSYFAKLNNTNKSFKQIIVICDYTPVSNYAWQYGAEFFANSDDSKNFKLHYDTALIRLLRIDSVKSGLIQLETDFFTAQVLESSQFETKIPVTTIKYRKYKRFFKSLLGKSIERGWEKFYKKYPASFGSFKFSKVVYSADYAFFYIGHQAGRLYGSGDIIILKQESNNWRIVNYINVWQS